MIKGNNRKTNHPSFTKKNSDSNRRNTSSSSSSSSSLRTRGFVALTLVGLTVISINIYMLLGGGLAVRQRRPLIPGIREPVLSKHGSLALVPNNPPPPPPPPHQPGAPHALLRRPGNNVSGDTVTDTVESNNNNTDGKERVVQILKEASIHVNATMRERLPTWQQVTQLVGSQPVILGPPTACTTFQQAVPPVRRMLGAAGMFSTGTNLVTTLLKNNCQIPERVTLYGPNASREDHGMRWQVPWGKHTPAHYKYAHAAKMAQKINKDDILPIITIRNPYQWMKSMCKNAYAARWKHARQHCPNLRLQDSNEWNAVTVKYGAGSETYTSLVHLFNDWYQEYTQNASYPWVMIRMEDLVFYTKDTITQVCECAGGRIRTDRPFVYTVDSAKADSPGHDTTVGFYEAWIRYSQPPVVQGGFSREDYQAAKAVLGPELMRIFGYRHPPDGTQAV